MNFTDFNFHPTISAGVVAAGFTHPTPIQERAIPKIMQRCDVLGLAQTGTGKTAAFGLPILHQLMNGPRGCVRALIIAPTRELAEQIHNSLDLLGQQTGLRSLTVYGGVGIKPQVTKLRNGVEIVVACPGRLLDHIKQGTINLRQLDLLVLDEADRMFDMGFLPDIRRIVKSLPIKRQTLLFSATMSKEIRTLAHELLTNPETIQVDTVAPAETVSHALYPVPQHLKTNLLLKILEQTETESVLIFTRTKHRAKRLGEKLSKCGYRAASLQGNLSQSRRQSALDGFRDGKFRILVATDIAARGIDVSLISHVINFDVPDTVDAYIHRIGRTGRAARTGKAFTLVSNDDKLMVRSIERILGTPIDRHQIAGFDYDVPAPKRVAQPQRRPAQPATRNKLQKNKPKPRSRTGNKQVAGGRGR
ncbi:ATP-dependent RNA helicase RhlE [Desulfuromusa kysingii]|uniref:DEAD-box ATP-dependent RNA helicase RhpA n=1 Tax=Desulfuromusa kysingii TaxID=37625 RepID=A0A1H3ZF52_9BACT|nr:DEAD/DEAH box helicase [Desulfuromusa kysingii]SEA22423.1 ATP-dependent RNA helicase RhlE [Desulfuromusa kysingii]